jgi:integrase
VKKRKLIQQKPDIPIPGLRVKCKQCNTWVASCVETGQGLETCPHKEQLTYLGVVHIPGTKHGRVVRDLGNNLNTAIADLAKLREDVQKGNLPEKKEKTEPIIPPQPIVLPTPAVTVQTEPQITLIEAMSKYIGFMNNVDVPKHLQRERSDDYIADIGRAFKYFCACLKKADYDIDNYPLAALSDVEVGIFYEYLIEEKDSSPYTYNRYLSNFTSFLTWARKKGYKVENVFEDVIRLDTETDSRSISQEHYEGIFPLISYENGFQYTPGKKKEVRNIFRDYLKTGYMLGLLTGRRREEIASLRFSSIHPDGMTMCVEDFKPNRIKNRKGSKKQFVHIPVIRQLRELLDELGYAEHKGTDRYLLAPEITENRVENIGDALSRSFSHYYKQIGTGDILTFKCLRKTYLSRLKIFLQKNPNQIDVKDISNHSGDAVLDKHYLDKRLIAAALVEMGFEIFPSRQKELQQLREKENPNENQIER